MKKILFVLTLAFLVTGLHAGPISMKQAQEKARSFVSQKKQSPVQQPLRLVTGADCLKKASQNGLFYVFNVGLDDGFVIVSGDDRTMPILGYTDKGTLDVRQLPDNMKAWLEGYSEQMKALKKMDDAQARTLLAAAENRPHTTRNSIAPMITTKWDQATPYWNECPEFMDEVDGEMVSEFAYTGCVATAMSQIMYFYKYPEQTSEPTAAYDFTYGDGLGNYGTAHVDSQPVTTFDWEHMLETYTGAEDDVYTSAVAHLMFYVGVAIKTQYGKGASGAYTDDIPKGFDFFGYGAKLAFRNDYTQQQWEQLVYEELAAGRPMIYNGTAGSGGGHSFVCDGFEYGDYFHINWGWGGMGNGFFQLAILNPHASGSGGSSSAEGYNMKQNICYNIIPGQSSGQAGQGTGGDVEEEEPALTVIHIDGPKNSAYYPAWERDRKADPFKIYKSKVVKVSFSDHDGTGTKFKEALALYDPENDTFTVLANSESYNFSTVTTSANGQTLKYGDGIQANASNIIKFGAGLTGNYRMVPVYKYKKDDGTESDWKLMKGADRVYLELDITTGGASATYHPQTSLAVEEWQFTGGEQVGKPEQVHCFLHNSGPDKFFGDLYLDFGGQQLDEMSNYTTVIQAEVPAGETKEVVFNVSPQSAGQKTVTLMTVDPTYGEFVNVPGRGNVTIAESQEAPMDLSVVIKAENAVPGDNEGDNDVIYDSHAHFSATITNNSSGEYNRYVLAPLFIVSKDAEGNVTGGTMVNYKQETLSLKAGESRTLYFDFDNLAYGSTYSLNIYARNEVPDEEDASHVTNIVEKGHSVYYDIRRGIIAWSADGTRSGFKPEEGFIVPADAAAVSVEALGLSSIVANENPNTLYFVGENETVPSGLDGKNIITGKTAGNVVLKDGYDFFTPQSFTAENISYERTFTTARTRGQQVGWGTLVLPFTPTAVKNATDDTDADWFRSAEEQDKDFWLCEFVDAEDDIVYFDHASAISANVPYLVAVSDKVLTNEPKTFVWSAENAEVKPDGIAFTSTLDLVYGGTMETKGFENIYCMDADGKQFDAAASATVDAFHAYFKWIQGTSEQTSLFISIPEEVDDQVATSIQQFATTETDAAVYNLNGQRVGTRSQFGQLPRGIYVIKNRKVTK